MSRAIFHVGLVLVALVVVPGYANAAAPIFECHIIDPLGAKGGGTSLVDIDDDGDLDLLFPHRDGAYYWYEYQSPDKWEKHQIGSPTDTDVGGCSFDVDGDGKMDAVTDMKWFKNPGQGEDWDKYYFGGTSGNHDVVGGDIDGDGTIDIVTMKGDGEFAWYKNPGNPTRVTNWEKTIIGKGIHGGVAPKGIGDLDGDGDNDLVRGDAWFENLDGMGKIFEEHPLNTGIPESRFDGGLCVRSWVADINADGKLDIVITGADTPDGSVLYYQGNGDGLFTKHTVAKGLGQDFHSMGVADFNLDGSLDLVVGGARESRSEEKRVYLFLNKGGLWESHLIATVKQSHELSVGDVDGDGDIDICSKSWGKEEVFYLENKIL